MKKIPGDLISIAIRPGGNIPYFPGLLSDEAMTSTEMLKAIGVRFEDVHLRINSGGFVYGYWSKSDQDNAKKKLFLQQQENNEIEKFAKSVLSDYQNIIGLLDNFYASPVLSRTKESYLVLYKELCDKYRSLCCYAYVANILDMAEDIREELSHYITDKTEIEKSLLDLTRNPRANFIYEHDLELIDILYISDTDLQQRKIEAHIKKWYSLFMGSIAVISPDPFVGIKMRIDMFKKLSRDDWEDRRCKYQDIFESVGKSQEALQLRLKLSKETIDRIKILKDCVFLKETRKFCMTRITTIADNFSVEMGKMFGIPSFAVFRLTPDELAQGKLMSGEVICEESIMTLKNNSMYVVDDGVTKRYIGDHAKTKIAEYGIELPVSTVQDENTIDDTSSKKVYSGFVACRGCGIGPVRLVTKLEDLNDFMEGDILVTSLTTPEYAIVFDKIKGMITYDGASLTSHPATLAREYGVPAILGIKDLQHKLNNGDIIEVDANNNAVRLLN